MTIRLWDGAPVRASGDFRRQERGLRSVPAVQRALTTEENGALARSGFVLLPGPFKELDDAWSTAEAVVRDAATTDDPLAVIGDFVIPPPDGPPSRDFQTLHFDFGLPLVPAVPADVARFTALHVLAGAPPSEAVTRLVPLRPLLADGSWPDRAELVRRFAAYGASHGAWDDKHGYVEGSLARVVEGALGQSPVLPSVKAQPKFLCGTEFATAADEQTFFAHRGLRPDIVEIAVHLRPGELVVFDNLTLAHGRRGRRQPGELRQRVFGYRALPIEQQVELRDRLLAAFAA